MKITNPNPPPALVKWFYELISVDMPTVPGTTTARQRRGSKKTITSKSAKRINKELELIAKYIAKRLDLKVTSQEGRDFICAEKNRIKSGTFDPKYWKKCAVSADGYKRSAATCEEDTNPPAYGFRNETMRPSTATYSDGTDDTAPIRAYGAVIDAVWQDIEWVWRKTNFSLPDTYEKNAVPPLVWATAGTIQVNATIRGSRPMLSLLMRAHIISDASPYITDNSAPVQPATSLYWRYAMPDTVAPFYHTALARSAQVALNWRDAFEVAENYSRVIVKFAVRPMLGHGYNNNMDVDTSYTGSSDLWCVHIAQTLGMLISTYFMQQDGKLRDNETNITSNECFRNHSDSLSAIDIGTGQLLWKIRNNLNELNEFIPPWEQNEWAGAGYNVRWMQPTNSGWIVALNFWGESWDTYFEINEEGALLEYWTDITRPGAWLLSPNQEGGTYFCQAINRYMWNLTALSGEPRIAAYSKYGVLDWVFDYYNIGIYGIPCINAHELGTDALVIRSVDDVDQYEIWRLTAQEPFFLHTINAPLTKPVMLSFFEGHHYIFQYGATAPCYKINEDGTETEIYHDPRIFFGGYSGPQWPWLRA